MANVRKSEHLASRELAPVPGDSYHQAIVEPVMGDYYYGRAPVRQVAARSYWQIFLRRRWTIFTIFLIIMGIGAALTYTRPRIYRARAEMLVTPIERPAPSNNIADSVDVLTRVRSVATEAKMLQSPDLLDEAYIELPLELRIAGFESNAPRLNRYPVSVVNPKDTDIITVEVTARHPDAAAQLANQICRTNQDRHRRTTADIAALATQHVDAELAKCEEDYHRTLNELAAFKQRHGVIDIGEQVRADAAYLATLETDAVKADVDRVRANVTRDLLQRELAEMSTVVEDTRVAADNPVIATINGEIERLQQKRAELLQEYKPSAPEVLAVDEQITDAKRRQREVIDSKTETVTVRRNPLLDSLREDYINAVVAEKESRNRGAVTHGYAGQVRARIANLPQSEKQIALLTSRIAELQSTHAYLAGQRESIKLSVHRGGLPNVMPFTRARPNYHPVSPNIPASLAVFFVLSSFIAVVVAVVRDQWDDRVFSAESLETVTGERVLTSLPRVRKGFRGLVTAEDSPPGLLESFRILRGSLLLSLDPLPRVIMITSPRPGDGKSTTVANLAATIAISGKRVLVIDCDMRHPSIHLIYGLENAVGLSTVLRDDAGVRECIWQTGIEYLDVLTAGPTPTHPPELLASETMTRIIDELREQYDTIILDSTPMVNLSDGSLIASRADGVVVVVSSDRTRQPELLVALRSLEQIGAPVLGLVYNRSLEAPALEWEPDMKLSTPITATRG